MREIPRNGDRDRDWDTRAGRIALDISKFREDSYFPSLREPRRTNEKALVAVIQVANVPGRLDAIGACCCTIRRRSVRTCDCFIAQRPANQFADPSSLGPQGNRQILTPSDR